jgi:glutamate N-acetyltransferase/amino-acid N-acetyltransferase
LGIAKGSGMIAPNMATMLSFIITDIKVSKDILQKVTSNLSDKTFNSITVDSDTSTSDMVLVSTTSSANMKPIEKFSDNRLKQFSKILELVMKELALEIVKDGEGAKKLIEYQIVRALNDKSAKNIALSIANSPLVKTAIAGEDPNWGRIIMAIGKSGENIIQEKIKIYFGKYLITNNGKVHKKYNEEKAKDYMKNTNLLVKVDLGIGKGIAKVWGCDFTKEYIEINADYRS